MGLLANYKKEITQKVIIIIYIDGKNNGNFVCVLSLPNDSAVTFFKKNKEKYRKGKKSAQREPRRCQIFARLYKLIIK